MPDTPEELGEKGIKALAAERAERKAAEKSLAEMTARLQALEAQHAAELDRLSARYDAALKERQAAAAKAELDAARQSVFRTKAIPAELEKYVTGASADELAASADAVLADFGASHPAGPSPSPFPPDPTLGASGAKPEDPHAGDPIAQALMSLVRK